MGSHFVCIHSTGQKIYSCHGTKRLMTNNKGRALILIMSWENYIHVRFQASIEV
jgi:hypothetical protein